MKQLMILTLSTIVASGSVLPLDLLAASVAFEETTQGQDSESQTQAPGGPTPEIAGECTYELYYAGLGKWVKKAKKCVDDAWRWGRRLFDEIGEEILDRKKRISKTFKDKPACVQCIISNCSTGSPEDVHMCLGYFDDGWRDYVDGFGGDWGRLLQDVINNCRSVCK